MVVILADRTDSPVVEAAASVVEVRGAPATSLETTGAERA
jgi:hypothetical protein